MDWDQYADTYRQVDDEATVPPLLKRVMDATSGRVLDVGCGEGALMDRLRDNYADRWKILGFEVSQKRADITGARGHEVLVSPDGVVPVPDGEFDLVVTCHVIEHVPDDEAYARELARVVRPGGHVYVETPVKLPGAWYFRRNPQAGWVLDPTHVREYRSAAAVNDVVSHAGLEIIDQELTPIAFPLVAGEVLIRRLLRLPQPTRRPTGLRAKEVKIPRYRQQAVLARRPV